MAQQCDVPPRGDGLWLHLITFDPFRTIGMPGVRYVRPENYLVERQRLQEADWLLFPEYWQVNSLHYALGCAIFPSVSSYHLGHDKIEMTRAFQALCPRHVPDTLILPATPAAVEEVLDVLGLPCVLKVPRSSMGQGVALIRTVAELRDWASRQPVLYAQELLPIRKDIRVVWVGDGVFTAYWREAAEGAFHNNVAQGGRIHFDAVPPQALELVAEVASRLKIDHAGFDVAMVGEHPYLLEFNTLFGNAALNRHGLRVQDAILRWLLARQPTPRSPSPLLAA
ncbi:ATP-grasp domain-containing protein [Ectothiorhodospira shaposhnikovii]|uniref:ATP-grasp domain-containing protein n=1 Tax=Ectothiorhodospira shaposhnikovii TaxID=1054 RepID=UPI0039A17F56